MSGRISIIIPTLNEASCIVGTLTTLQSFRQQGHEVIVVDGGSRDNTVDLARPFSDLVLQCSAAHRARQMNIGAAHAHGDIYLFLHADTRTPPDACSLIHRAMNINHVWGRFNVTFTGSHPLLGIIAGAMNWRSLLTGIATGDQGIFVHRTAFRLTGGYPDIALMEDIRLSASLKSLSRPACLLQTVITSSRRWESNGILKTVLFMWRLRLAFFLGRHPTRLARLYQ